MTYAVLSGAPDPLTEFVATDPETGEAVRWSIASGVVAVAPTEMRGIRVSIQGQPPVGDDLTFYVAGVALPPTGAVEVGVECSLTQTVIDAMLDNQPIAYGIGSVAATLMANPEGTARWVSVSMKCYGGQPLGVRYRVTLRRPHTA